MRSRNCPKEIVLDHSASPVPITATTAIFVLIVVVAVLFARQVNAFHHTAAQPTPAPAAGQHGSR